MLKSVDLRRRNREEILGFHLWDQGFFTICFIFETYKIILPCTSTSTLAT